MILVVHILKDHFVEFTRISKLQSHFSVLVFTKIVVYLIGEIDHLLIDFDAYEHVVVIEHLGEELSRSHAHLDNGYLVIVLLDVTEHFLEKCDFIQEELAHA